MIIVIVTIAAFIGFITVKYLIEKFFWERDIKEFEKYLSTLSSKEQKNYSKTTDSYGRTMYIKRPYASN